MCPTFVYDSKGRVIAVGLSRRQSELLLINPYTLEVISKHRIPPRPLCQSVVTFITDADAIFRDTSGGAYFFVDHEDRIIVPTSERDIRIFEQRDHNGRHEFQLVQTLELRRDIPLRDKLTAALPAWHQEGVYWFTSREGRVGTAHSQTNDIKLLNLRNTNANPEGTEAEEIQNSFAVGPDGVFIVSDHALYRFVMDGVGQPELVWRTPYERGQPKPGQVGPGSGTTPTLIGNKFVAIGDNAQAMKVLVYRREDGKLVGQHEVFTRAGSACENSFIAYKFSLVICNTYGYISPFNTNDAVQAGLTRIDVHPFTGQCSVKWHKPINILSTTPKLSTSNHIIYAYTKEKLHGQDTWVILGIRFEDGEKVFTLPISRPMYKSLVSKEYDMYDNAWGPMYIGLNQWGEKSLFVGMIHGFLQVTEQR
jgi:hypothetical protein